MPLATKHVSKIGRWMFCRTAPMEISSDSLAAIPPIQRRVALVKDEIDDLKHRIQPLRQFLWRRYLVWNRNLSNLCLCAHNALRQGRRRNQKRPGQSPPWSARDFTHGTRNLSFRRQSGMAAREGATAGTRLTADLF